MILASLRESENLVCVGHIRESAEARYKEKMPRQSAEAHNTRVRVVIIDWGTTSAAMNSILIPRWIAKHSSRFAGTGKMMEKYEAT